MKKVKTAQRRDAQTQRKAEEQQTNYIFSAFADPRRLGVSALSGLVLTHFERCSIVTLLIYFAALITSPFFMTNLIFVSAVTSSIGSSLTAMMSAYLPTLMLPTFSFQPNKSAPLIVAD